MSFFCGCFSFKHGRTHQPSARESLPDTANVGGHEFRVRLPFFITASRLMVWNGRRESITYRYSWTVEYAGLPTKLCRACDYGIKPRINTDIRRPARHAENGRGHPRRNGRRERREVRSPNSEAACGHDLDDVPWCLNTWSNNTFQGGHVESIVHKIYTCYLRNIITLCTFKFVQPTLFKLCQTRLLDVIATRSHMYLCTILNSYE